MKSKCYRLHPPCSSWLVGFQLYYFVGERMQIILTQYSREGRGHSIHKEDNQKNICDAKDLAKKWQRMGFFRPTKQQQNCAAAAAAAAAVVCAPIFLCHCATARVYTRSAFRSAGPPADWRDWLPGDPEFTRGQRRCA